MKLNSIGLWVGVLMLMPSLAIAPAAAQSGQAKDLRLDPPKPSSSSPSPKIQLTPAQQQQLAGIQEQTRRQMMAILTEAQREVLTQAKGQGKTLQEAIAAMNLTETQKTQISQVVQRSRAQVNAVLTPQQQEQLKQQLRDRP